MVFIICCIPRIRTVRRAQPRQVYVREVIEVRRQPGQPPMRMNQQQAPPVYKPPQQQVIPRAITATTTNPNGNNPNLSEPPPPYTRL